MRIRLLALAVAATVATACVAAAGATPRVHNGAIAYAYLGRADYFTLYTITAAGKHARELAHRRHASDRDPAYSPNGRRIAFVRSWKQGDLWTMTAAGRDPIRLTWTKKIDELSPAWSPDGTQIAFSVDSPAARQGIWVVAADGHHRRQITPGADSDPTWSPDGNQIAYASGGAIWVVPAGGGAATQLTFPGTDPEGQPYFDGQPAWSPDGCRILFTSDRGDPAESFDQLDLWTLNVCAAGPGPNVTRVTHTPERDERDPAWSPDGRRIVYDSTGSLHGAASSQLEVAAASGANAHFITHSCGDCAYANLEPSWQPVR